MSKKTKLIIALVVSAVVVVSFAGVAYGADSAIPGETLYGFDCALEDVGIGDGGLEERLGEAGELIDDGQVEEAADLVAEALIEEGDTDGDGDVDEDDGDLEDGLGRQEALLAAAAAVLAGGSEQSLEVRQRVAEKLTFMATTELTGREYGQAVSQLARGIYGDEAQDEDLKGNGKGNNGKGKGHSK